MPPPRDTRSEASVSTTAADDPPPRPRVLVAPPPAQTARPLRQAMFASPDFPLELPDDLRAEGVFVNLDGDYSYLTDGYYRTLEAEHEGQLPIPTVQDALDAYVVPLALTRAAAAGLGTPQWEIINDHMISFEPPFILYPINPYMDEGQVVAEQNGLSEAIKSLSMSGKYAMVCQHLPPDSRVDTVRLVLGQCLNPDYQELSARLWRIFRLPLARVRIIVTEREFLFSAISPLKKEELTQNEKAIIKEAGLWRG